MNLSKREFLQVLGAASAAGMGLGSCADADAATAQRRRVKARKINTPTLIGVKGNTGMATTTA
jgi:sulfur-oxidizing protein SoxB